MVDLPNPSDSQLIDVNVCHLVTPEAVEMTFKAHIKFHAKKVYNFP